MSRAEWNFGAAQDAALDAAELLAALRAQADVTQRDRQQAIACFLAGGEGWREALLLLEGAFASAREGAGLRPGQEG